MEHISEDLILEFVNTLDTEGVDENANLEEAVRNATAKFRARVKAHKKVGKHLPPSKYLKKYGAPWMNLKNEFEPEAEVVSELKDVLRRYIPKAKDDQRSSWDRAREMENLADKAYNKGQDTKANSLWDKRDAAVERGNKRAKGIHRAETKLGEETEVVDELYRKTLGIYKGKAEAQAKELEPKTEKAAKAMRTLLRGRKFTDSSPYPDYSDDEKRNFKTLHKRQSGLDRVRLKLRKGRFTKLPEEIDNAQKETTPKASKLNAGEIAYQYIKKRKGQVEASKIRKAGIDGSLQSAESFEPLEEGSKKGLTPAKAKKEERLALNRKLKNTKRDLEAKWEMRTSKTGVPHSSGHGVSEEVKIAKGSKKDKRATTSAADVQVPTMPAGMNAGMRMMPEEVIAEISKDKVYAAYKERYAQAKAHHDVGDSEGAKKHGEKALRSAEYHAKHGENQEKYKKIAAAREIIAKRAKKPDPDAEARLALKKRREARSVLYGQRKKKDENAQ